MQLPLHGLQGLDLSFHPPGVKEFPGNSIRNPSEILSKVYSAIPQPFFPPCSNSLGKIKPSTASLEAVGSRVDPVGIFCWEKKIPILCFSWTMWSVQILLWPHLSTRTHPGEMKERHLQPQGRRKEFLYGVCFPLTDTLIFVLTKFLLHHQEKEESAPCDRDRTWGNGWSCSRRDWGWILGQSSSPRAPGAFRKFSQGCSDWDCWGVWARPGSLLIQDIPSFYE